MRAARSMAALVIYRDGKVLVRKDGRSVAPPIGAVGDGEPFIDACRRLLRDELGLHTAGFRHLSSALHRAKIEFGYEDRMLNFFECIDWDGEPQDKGGNIMWIGQDELDRISADEVRDVLRDFFAGK